MKEKFSIDDFLNPIESIERTLEMLQEFYTDDRFEDMVAGKELIESYEKALGDLDEVAE